MKRPVGSEENERAKKRLSYSDFLARQDYTEDCYFWLVYSSRTVEKPSYVATKINYSGNSQAIYVGLYQEDYATRYYRPQLLSPNGWQNYFFEKTTMPLYMSGLRPIPTR